MALPSALLLALVLAPAPAPPGPSPAWASAQADRRSLEELLEEARRARARREAELQPQVVAVMATLDETQATRPTATTDAAKRELLGLGEDALPLLIPFLDPGGESTAGSRMRARIVGEVLHDLPSLGVTAALLELAVGGGPVAQRHALYALRTTPEPERVFEPLATFTKGIRTDRGDDQERYAALQLKANALKTIAALGTEASRAFLDGILSGGDAEDQRLALAALGEGPLDEVRGQLITLLRSPTAVALAGPVGSFLTERDELLDDEELAEAAMALALEPSIDAESRVALLDTVRLTDADVSSTHRRRLEKDYAEASLPEVRTAALQLLARHGSRSAKRALLDGFDERLAGTRNLDWAYRDRALVYHAIGDWSAAVKDWRMAMKHQQDNRFRQADGTEQVGIARSLARMGKFREAAEYLSSSPLSLADLQALARERDFREMRESKYAEVFRL